MRPDHSLKDQTHARYWFETCITWSSHEQEVGAIPDPFCKILLRASMLGYSRPRMTSNLSYNPSIIEVLPHCESYNVKRNPTTHHFTFKDAPVTHRTEIVVEGSL